MPRPRHDGSPAKPVSKLKLTDPFIKAIVPATERSLYWDTLVPGLALAVTPTGHRSWRFVYRSGGRLRIFSIGRLEAVGLAAARDRARVLLGKVAEGADPQAEKQRGARAESFADVAAQYREHAKTVNRSWKQSDFLIRKYVLPKWASRRARDVTRGDVRSIVRSVTGGGSPIMANQILAAASAVFSWAIREEVGEITLNPCVGVTRNKTTSRERVLSHAEMPAFWSGFDRAGLVRSSALKAILLTGQRPGEVAGMRLEHIRNGWWELPGMPDPATGWAGTKNAESHRVWLSEPVRRMLAEIGEGRQTGFAFPGNDRGTRAVNNLDGAMQKICACLGIKDRLTPHDLRRTHGTMITSLGYGREAMNRLQNHKEGGIGSVYDRHSYASENRAIQEAVTRRLMSLVNGEPEGSSTVQSEADVIQLSLERRRA